MNTLLVLLTLAAWAAIIIAVKDMWRIYKTGFVKQHHIRDQK
jgi:hypothetical protein